MTFHDSTFECLSESYEIANHSGSMKEILSLMVIELE